MSKELIERLRYESPGPNHIATEAADRIEKLETERDQLSEQVKMLRDALLDCDASLDQGRGKPASLDEALAATELSNVS